MTMGRILILALVLCAALPAAEFTNASEAEAPLVAEHTPFRASISVRNTNDRAFKVKGKPDSTCTCSRLELSETFLLPGQAATLEIEIPNHFRSGLQRTGVSIYSVDPEFDPIEVVVRWKVLPDIAVDLLPKGADPLQRPADRAYQDVYRAIAHERPDENERLRKRFRLFSPPESAPEGGLQVLGIDYPGTLWAFEAKRQDDGSWLVLARARDQDKPLPEGRWDETAVVRTNHPRKAQIKLGFTTRIAKDAHEAPVDLAAPPPPLR